MTAQAKVARALRDAVGFFDEMETIVIAAGEEAFLGNRALQLVACALWINIGEAANRCGDRFQSEHPEVGWSGVRRQRDLIAHGHHKVDWRLVWRSTTVHLSVDIARMRVLLADLT